MTRHDPRGGVARPAPRRAPRPDCAEQEGFSLHAGVGLPGGRRQREALERLCRYVARPVLAGERLSELPDGRLAYELRHRWSDRTRQVVFEPQAPERPGPSTGTRGGPLARLEPPSPSPVTLTPVGSGPSRTA